MLSIQEIFQAGGIALGSDAFIRFIELMYTTKNVPAIITMVPRIFFHVIFSLSMKNAKRKTKNGVAFSIKTASKGAVYFMPR